MTYNNRCSLNAQTQAAITELKMIILARYPEATFAVERDDAEPEVILLYATVDLEDRWELLDHVTDRQTEILVEDGIPILIIPERTPERNRAVEEALRSRPVGDHAPLLEHP